MKNLLILESNESFAEELRTYFESVGDYVVCGVYGDGAEGLDAIRKTQPDVIVMSLLLKTLDGFSVLERGAKEAPSAIFLVLGNFSDDKVVARAVDLGASYYLIKPITAEAVAENLERLVAAPASKDADEPRGKKKIVNLDERISNIFISIGIPPHIKGYSYLREGIKMAVEDPRIINNITKGLYPTIGEKFQTSASKVERAIRHAIEVAWNRGRIDAVNAIFGARVYIGTEKPTNSEFIALVADKLILESMA